MGRSSCVTEILFDFLEWNHKHHLKCIQQQQSKLHLIKETAVSFTHVLWQTVNSIAKIH